MGSGAFSPPPQLRPLGPGIAGVVSLLAFAALGIIPVFGFLIAVLAPLPLTHLAGTGRPSILGWGWVAVLLGGLAAATGSAFAGFALLGYLLVAAWPAVAVEFWSRRLWPTGRWTALVTAVPLAAVAVTLVVVASPQSPADFVGGFLLPVGEQGAQWSSWLQPRGGDADELLRWLIPVIASLVPAIVALYVLAVAVWLRRRLPLLGFSFGGEPFCNYRSEEWLPAGFVAGALGWVFLDGLLKWLAGNLLAAVLGLYFLHGVAIILFHLGRRLGENRWVRAFVVVLGLQLPLTLVFAALGLADVFVALRRGERRE